MNHRVAPETEELWDEFHRAVNMSSEELRPWLLTDASGTDGMPAEPDLGVPEMGRHVVRILRKRKVDLTEDDLDAMRQVVDRVNDLLAHPPGTGASNEKWRHSLMDLGHDPLKPDEHGDD
ncbi:DUF3140 domain-containing protein [Actinomadura flavalba]|uniref:DUF3140 domain-containing protein n=1 Tax=Actinomadura flavalba TaxID=1120938 RepID=UPI000361602C|nr:DUF3140 domain-containing protein [Actinomadura flavalba]